MPLRIYVPVFMLLAVIFAPTLLSESFPSQMFCVPLGAVPIIASRFDVHWEAQGGGIVAFFFLFYCLANIAYGFAWLVPTRTGKIIAQTVFLSLVFACSFLRVITYDDGTFYHHHSGGHYTFWEAVFRYFETKSVD